MRVKSHPFQKRVNARIGFAELLESMIFVWIRVKSQRFQKSVNASVGFAELLERINLSSCTC